MLEIGDGCETIYLECSLVFDAIAYELPVMILVTACIIGRATVD